MNKIKYIAAVMIGIAGLGLQQAKATRTTEPLTPADPTSTFTVSNGEGTGTYGTLTWSVDTVAQTATFTFTANTAAGYFLVDGNIANVNLLGNSALLIGSVVETPTNDFKDVAYNAQADGFGKFTVQINDKSASVQISSITFTVQNTSLTSWTDSNVLALNSQGWDAAIHYIDNNIGAPNTFFAGEGAGTIPDGGTTVMLLGTALGALGMARRFLMG